MRRSASQAVTQGAAGEGYRPDVDGLRAVAVLAVVVFHISKPLIPGGFLGVDVFFVISGYLITRNILENIHAGRFTIAEFYRRRVKRIAPVMVVVVGVTLVASQLLLLPEDARNNAESVVFSLASLANVYFWKYQDTGYFAADSAELPLLHLWSLGVEEQFYVLWPLILMAVYRPGRGKILFAGAFVIAAASFVLGDVWYDGDPSFVYYMLPTRAGELLMGALVAIAVVHRVERRITPALIPVIATAGAVTLLACFWLITERQRFPGVRAIPPTAATAALILAGHCGTSVWTRLLAAAPLVWVGLISYSAYMWHWPLLAYYRYVFGQPGPIAGVAALVLTLTFAWMSYRFIEQPARRTTAPLWRVFAGQFVVPAGALTAIALAAVFSPWVGKAVHSETAWSVLQAERDQVRPAYEFDWVCQSFRLSEKDLASPHCVLGPESAGEPRALLWGDSHAAHYIGMVDAFAQAAGFRFRNATISSCPPLLSDPAPFIDGRRVADCRASLDLLKPIVERFPVVIVSSAYPFYAAGYLDAFFDTVRRLAEQDKLVIVLGEAPWMPGYDRRCRQKAVLYPFLRCPLLTVPLAAEVVAVNAALERFAASTPNVRYFDVTPYVCPGAVCSAFGADGEPRYFDQHHLSLVASSKLGRDIVADGGVPDSFALVTRWAAGEGEARRLTAERH